MRSLKVRGSSGPSQILRNNFSSQTCLEAYFGTFKTEFIHSVGSGTIFLSRAGALPPSGSGPLTYSMGQSMFLLDAADLEGRLWTCAGRYSGGSTAGASWHRSFSAAPNFNSSGRSFAFAKPLLLVGAWLADPAMPTYPCRPMRLPSPAMPRPKGVFMAKSFFKSLCRSGCIEFCSGVQLPDLPRLVSAYRCATVTGHWYLSVRVFSYHEFLPLGH